MSRFSKYLYVVLIVLALAPARALAQDHDSDSQILHLINRITYGPTPGMIDDVRRMGTGAYIEQQLHPETLPPSPTLENRLHQLPTVYASLPELVAQYEPNHDEGKLSPEERRALNEKLNAILFELSDAKIMRSVGSPAQLQEVLTDFWFNHFNVFFGKDADRFLIATYERDAIRPFALGKFRDLLGATAHHPAMLFYLDNWQNTAPDSFLAQRAALHGKTLGINENYAREIMELHTLGVDGGYTQPDVTILARILTGWGIGRGNAWIDRATFAFDSKRHDYGDQVFLEQTIHGGGSEEIEQVLDILATSPSTAHHIAYQLAQYFVADDPPASLVNKMAVSYSAHDGDIVDVLRTMFASPEFWDPQYEQKKFKPPLRYIVSSLRALGGVPDIDLHPVQGAIAQMGEPLYRCQTPNGYANTNDQWLNSDTLLKRIDDAKRLAHYFGADAGENIWRSQGQTWSRSTWTAVKNANVRDKPSMLLASPEFLYY